MIFVRQDVPGEILIFRHKKATSAFFSVGDPDPQDPHVLGHPDPDLDPLIRGMDPAPDPSLFS